MNDVKMNRLLVGEDNESEVTLNYRRNTANASNMMETLFEAFFFLSSWRDISSYLHHAI